MTESSSHDDGCRLSDDGRNGDERRPLLAGVPGSKGKHVVRTESGISAKLNEEPRAPWGPLVVLLAISAVQPLCFELIFPFVNQMVLENGITDDPEKVGFYTGFIESIFQVTGVLAVLPCSWISDRIGRKPVILVGTLGMALSIALFGMSKSYAMMIAMRCVGGTLGGVMAAIKTSVGELYPNRVQLAQALALWQISYKVGQVIGQPLGGLLSHPARTMPFFDTPFFREYPFALPCFVSGASAIVLAIWALFALPESLRKSDPSTHDMEGKESKSSIRSLPVSVISILISIFVMVMSSEMVFVVYPLFAFTPIRSGGLGQTEPQIGMHMGLRCAINILVLFSYTPFAAHVNSMKLYRLCMWLWPIAVIFFPLLHAIAHAYGANTPVFFSVLVAFFVLWSAGNLVWPSSQIVLQNASPSPEALATINGLAQMIYMIMFAVTPASITSLFAYSVEHNVLGGNMVYVVMICIGIFGGFYCLAVKDPQAKEKQPLDEESS